MWLLIYILYKLISTYSYIMLYYFGILISGLMLSITPFIQNNLIKNNKIDNFVINSVCSIMFLSFIYILIKRINIFENIKNQDNISIFYIFLFTIYFLMQFLILTYLINNFDETIIPPIKYFEIVFIIILSSYLNNTKLKFNQIIGLIITGTGLFITYR